MCTCNRYHLDQLNINCNYSYAFDNCNCSEDHEIFAVRCEICPYNLVSFARNYFSSIGCSCLHVNKNIACVHCKRLRNALNFDTLNLFLKKEDLPREFKLVEIDKHFGKHIRADPIFYYSKEDN